MTGTFWNGEPTDCARGTATLPDDLPAVGTWPARTAGQRIRIVRVFYAGQSFDLDDDAGRGWAKVTTGHGGPRYGHRNVTVEWFSFLPDSFWRPLDAPSVRPATATRPSKCPDGDVADPGAPWS